MWSLPRKFRNRGESDGYNWRTILLTAFAVPTRTGVILEADTSARRPEGNQHRRISSRDSHASTGASVPGRDGLGAEIRTTRVGLQVPVALAFEKWQRVGVQISKVANSSAWCLGDWLVYGQREYRDRYLHAIAESGLDYQTLRNYAWVARKFELERRRHTLSFQHHVEVSSLAPKEQDRWLDLAEEFHWSRNDLRKNIRTHRQQDGRSDTPKESLPTLSVAADRVQRWRQAAELSSETFEHWVLRALDETAAADLGHH